MKIDIVTAAYNEEEGLGLFIENILKMLANKKKWEGRLIIVDDGSTDNTWNIIKRYHSLHSNIVGLQLSRNFGHHLALFTGIEQCDADYVVMMDCDLQDNPEFIPVMIDTLTGSGFDLIYGIKKEFCSKKISKMCSTIFWLIINKITKHEMPHSQSVFRCFNKKVLNAVNLFTERDRFLAGTFAWVGFKSTSLELNYQPRKHGTSKYTFSNKVKQFFTAVLFFSDLPLKYILMFGLILTSLSFILGIYTLISYLFYFVSPGYTSLVCLILFSVGINMMVLGIIGLYVAKIFNETKMRPFTIVSEKFD